MSDVNVDVPPEAIRTVIDDWLYANANIIRDAVNSAVHQWFQQNGDRIVSACRRGAWDATINK